ncbi:unnamed protein product, partial [marine sediment metagenome]
MDKQRILKEAQKLASKFSFWMVSGNIAHLYGYVFETTEKKFELEIKFDEKFPTNPPKLIYHKDLKELLGEVQLDNYKNWTPESNVVDIVDELKSKIQENLEAPKSDKDLSPIKANEGVGDELESEEYITPDLNAYPSDDHSEDYITPSDSSNDFLYDKQTPVEPSAIHEVSQDINSKIDANQSYNTPLFDDSIQNSLEITTELGLIQQEYAYDQ